MKSSLFTITVLVAALTLSGCGPYAWEQAQEVDTVEALEEFVLANPDSEFVDTANARIEELVWADAESGEGSDGYRRYIERFPDGKRSDQAKGRIAEIGWQEAAALNSIKGFAEYLRSDPPDDRVPAAREAVKNLRADATAVRPAVELSGMFMGGMVKYVDHVAARYDGEIAGLPASVSYVVSAGTNEEGEPPCFVFKDGDNVLSIRGNASVQGAVELQTPDNGIVTNELFGLAKSDDDDLVGSFLVGRSSDLLWSDVDGLTLTPAMNDAEGEELAADEAVLFAVHDNFRLLYLRNAGRDKESRS